LAIAQSLGHATSVFEQVLGGPAATFGNKNVLATYLGALLFPSLIWVLGGGKKGRFLRGLPFVLVLAGLTVTRSRGGWLAALLAGLVLAGACAVSRRQRRVATLVLRRSTPWLVVGGVLALVLAGTPAPPGSSAGSVLANAAQADVATSSLAVRRAFDTSSLAMLRDHPFGVGLGSWRAAYPAYARLAPTTDFSLTLQPWEAHCDPLEIFCETGILGGLAFFLAIGATVRAALRPQAGESTARKLGSLLISLGVIEVLLHSLVDFPLRRPASALLFHVWLGLLAGSERGGKPAFSAISRPVLRGAGARPSASTSGDAGDGGPTFTGALVMIAAAASIVFHLRGIVADRRVAEARRSADTRTMYDRFQRAEALFPYSFQLHREAARTAHLGCYQGVVPCPVARAAIGRVLADEPHQPRYLTDEGALALQAGDDETARRAYTKAVAVLPAEPACLEGLASVEERLGDHDCATALRAAARDLRSGR
jgi:O-antigen ligase